jgi:hypothetical protein
MPIDEHESNGSPPEVPALIAQLAERQKDHDALLSEMGSAETLHKIMWTARPAARVGGR